MNVSLLILAALCAAGKDAHLDANPLYRELRQQGVRVGAQQRVPRPRRPRRLVRRSTRRLRRPGSSAF